MEYIEIDKYSIPYRFEIELAGEVFELELHYNYDYDFFTVDISKGGVVLAYGERMVYGRRLFSALSDSELPKVALTPLDPSGQAARVGWDELGDTVFLMVGEV